MSDDREGAVDSATVTWAYRLILGREPESEAVVRQHVENHASLAALRRTLIASEEFRNDFYAQQPSALRVRQFSRHTDFSATLLEAPAEEARELVLQAARKIHGEAYNYYSDALRLEIVRGFDLSIAALEGRAKVDYLEIGACKGLSMALIGTLLRKRGILGRLVSIDPYFEGGYVEGAHSPFGQNRKVGIDKRTRDAAFALYGDLGLDVGLLEFTSAEGMKRLLCDGAGFDLIYVDGSHERFWPTIDFSLAALLLRKDGVLILDDHLWADVEAVKQLCDKHGTKVQETWKTVSYRIEL